MRGFQQPMDRLELSSNWNPFTKQVRWRSWGFWETSAIEWICIIQILNLAIKCHLHMFTFIGKFSLRRSAPCYLIYFSYQINLPKLRMRFIDEIDIRQEDEKSVFHCSFLTATFSTPYLWSLQHVTSRFSGASSA